MNNKNLDALFTGLTGTPKTSSSELPSANKVSEAAEKHANTSRQSSESVAEERFCTIVQSDILRKIRIIANREGLQIKEVVNDGRMKGDAKNLF